MWESYDTYFGVFFTITFHELQLMVPNQSSSQCHHHCISQAVCEKMRPTTTNYTYSTTTIILPSELVLKTTVLLCISKYTTRLNSVFSASLFTSVTILLATAF